MSSCINYIPISKNYRLLILFPLKNSCSKHHIIRPNIKVCRQTHTQSFQLFEHCNINELDYSWKTSSRSCTQRPETFLLKKRMPPFLIPLLCTLDMRRDTRFITRERREPSTTCRFVSFVMHYSKRCVFLRIFEKNAMNTMFNYCIRTIKGRFIVF